MLQNFQFGEYSIFVYKFGQKHVKPSISKIFKTNIILIINYLNFNWNIVKSYIFYQNMIDLKYIFSNLSLVPDGCFVLNYEGGSTCNENPFITPYTNALGFYAICQTKDQSVAVIMVYKTLFYLSKFNKLQTI